MSEETEYGEQQNKKHEEEVPCMRKEMVGAVVLAQMISMAIPDPMVNLVICEALSVLEKTLSDDMGANLDANLNNRPDVVSLANRVQEMATKMQ